MSGYTKVPWVAGWNCGLTGPRTPSVGGATVLEALGKKEGKPVCNTHPVAMGMQCVAIAVGNDEDEAVEISKLLAAAPDLLEALYDLRTYMWSQGYADQTPAMAKADAAIAKAEGK